MVAVTDTVLGMQELSIYKPKFMTLFTQNLIKN